MLNIIMFRIKKLKQDYKPYLLMTVMVLLLTFIMGNAMNGDYKRPVAIIDQDQSEYSQTLINEISKEPSYKLTKKEYDKAVKEVENGGLLVAIVIEKGFQKAIENDEAVEISLVKIKDSTELVALENIIRSILDKIINNKKLAKITVEYIEGEKGVEDQKQLEDEIYERANKLAKTRKTITTHISQIGTTSYQEYDTMKHYVIGFTLFFSMYTIVFGIGDILEQKKAKTWYRQIVSPVSLPKILGGNLIATYILGVFQIGLLVLAGKYLFGVEWGNITAVIIVIVAYIFTITSLGLFLSGMVKTHEQLTSLVPIVLTSTSMLGGCMWPLEIITSKPLLILSNIIPQKWAVEALENVSMRGADINAVLFPSIILLGMGMIYFIVGVKLVRKT